MAEQPESKLKEPEIEQQSPKEPETIEDNPPKENEQEQKKDEQPSKEPQNDVRDEKQSEISDASDIKRPDFSGIWILKTNQNLDAFMKSQGIGYLKRKLMSMASITLTLKHNDKDNILQAKAKLPIGEINEEIPLNGTDKETTTQMGDKINMS
eukprot:289311_1